MTRKRHLEPLVRTLALSLPDGFRTESHVHDWAQLVHASRGALTVETETETRVVPATRALWVPAGHAHRLVACGPTELRTVYVSSSAVDLPPGRCRVIRVAPLLRELVLHVVELGALTDDDPRHERLAHLLLDLTVSAEDAPLDLPWPQDRRARRVARRIVGRPGEQVDLDELADESGASTRTVERLFRRETGLTLGRWRRQARMLAAVERLARGRDVTTVAMDVGYESTSAFIAAFRRSLGTSPGRYLDAAAPPASQ